DFPLVDNGYRACFERRDNGTKQSSFCRYGKPGDVLYVREQICANSMNGAIYAADSSPVKIEGKSMGLGDYWDWDNFSTKRKSIPSIHMPKNTARIWLKVESVKVERVKDI